MFFAKETIIRKFKRKEEMNMSKKERKMYISAIVEMMGKMSDEVIIIIYQIVQYHFTK